MASLFNVKDNNDKVQIAQSSRRIVDLTQAVSRVEQHQQSHSQSSASPRDWTGTYKYWNDWEDVEELQAEVTSEELRLEALLEKNTNPMGHCHSHTEERRMFEQPEEDKMAFCERHRLLGNYLYSEGVLPKAAEQYKTALSYYDYCFPEDSGEQQRLEEVRHAAQCNLSLCLRQMGYGKEALEMASQAVRDSQDRRRHFPPQVVGKALYRRAQAYRLLDEFDLSVVDLRAAAGLVEEKEAAAVARELQNVQLQKREYEENSKVMARKMLAIKRAAGDGQDESAHPGDRRHDHHTHHHDRRDSSGFPAISCLNVNIPLEPRCV